MAIERVSERSDGLTNERVIERDAGPTTTYVDRGGGNIGGVLIGIAALALIAIVAFFLLSANRNDSLRTSAVTSAASSVGDAAQGAAQGVTGAADRAADAVNPR